MNIWHDMPSKFISKDEFIAIIEISKGGKVKYELDKETGLIKMDRILYTSTHYPANYGFIPKTYADDNDPLDVLVLCTEELLPLTEVLCLPIGVFLMVDDGKLDEKIIAVPKADPVYNHYKDVDDLPDHIFAEIKHFFNVYKTLEGKTSYVKELMHAEDAKITIENCMKNYEKFFGE